MVEAVVASGDDEEEPDGQNLARGERSLPVERGGEVAVQRGRQVQALEGGPQDGEVGHDFHAEQPGFGGVHPAKLPTPTIPENHPEHERTVCRKCRICDQGVPQVEFRELAHALPDFLGNPNSTNLG